MNMRVLLTFTILLIAQNIHAQQNAKAYTDLKAYKDANSLLVQNVSIIKRTNGDIKMNGGNDYKITTVDKDISKAIKKKYWGVELNDTLYLNMKMMTSKWYAPALFRSSRYIYFRAGVGNIKGAQASDAYGAGIMFGAVGGAMAGASAAMMRYDYLLDIETGNTIVLTKKSMKNLLITNPELQNRYIKDGTPENKDSYIKYLKELTRNN